MLLLAVSLSGCFARGFDHNVLTTHLQQTPIVGTDEEITKAQALKPQLSFPCRVAVYLPPQVSGRWKAKEKEIVDSWEASLKKEGIVTDMFVMSEMLTRGANGENKSPTLMDLRVAAAKHGANALLVIQGDCEVDSYKNPAAVLNLTIIGGYVVPASHRDALVVLQGALVDVGNGFLYASVEAEGEGHIVRPTFIVEDKPAVERAKQQALTNFGPELLKRMRAVRANYASGGVVPAVMPAITVTPMEHPAPAITAPPKEPVKPVAPVAAAALPPAPPPLPNRAAEKWAPPPSTKPTTSAAPATFVPVGSTDLQPISATPPPATLPTSKLDPIIVK
jgi:hypothetical protein